MVDTIEEVIFLPKKQYDFMERCLKEGNSHGSSNLCTGSGSVSEKRPKNEGASSQKEAQSEEEQEGVSKTSKPFNNYGGNVHKEKKVQKEVNSSAEKKIIAQFILDDDLVDQIGRPYKRMFLSFIRIIESNKQMGRRLLKIDNLTDILKNVFSKKKRIIRNERRFFSIVFKYHPNATYLFPNFHKIKMYLPQQKAWWKL